METGFVSGLNRTCALITEIFGDEGVEVKDIDLRAHPGENESAKLEVNRLFQLGGNGCPAR